MDSDAGIFLRREPFNAARNDGDAADVMMHCYQIPFTLNTNRLVEILLYFVMKL